MRSPPITKRNRAPGRRRSRRTRTPNPTVPCRWGWISRSPGSNTFMGSPSTPRASGCAAPSEPKSPLFTPKST
ncbi:hypothetical protein AV530_013867 [Patagioenas fasciata monilis]|uniref:Uncharacterized protein n=1 Tax=Patagioenas fasciata monilis TaxID=372326 RepID=A0A1V4KZQ6_PATFA|nr:hypothetical protein AV530_013867 [Patagioenas fasciata monilis]